MCLEGLIIKIRLICYVQNWIDLRSANWIDQPLIGCKHHSDWLWLAMSTMMPFCCWYMFILFDACDKLKSDTCVGIGFKVVWHNSTSVNNPYCYMEVLSQPSSWVIAGLRMTMFIHGQVLIVYLPAFDWTIKDEFVSWENLSSYNS